jgi:hypothetical protein
MFDYEEDSIITLTYAIGYNDGNRTSADTARIVIKLTDKVEIGINDVFLSENLSVYPVPFTNSFTVANKTGQSGNARLCTMDGKVVHNMRLLNGANVYSTSTLSNGIYVLTINVDGAYYSKVVEKD